MRATADFGVHFMADDNHFGKLIAYMGVFGSAIYATLNRLLIPFGLHHALNNVFWFDTVGFGDLTVFWAGKTSADVSWSVGMYMSGFFVLGRSH